jgi:hypothetical protein
MSQTLSLPAHTTDRCAFMNGLRRAPGGSAWSRGCVEVPHHRIGGSKQRAAFIGEFRSTPVRSYHSREIAAFLLRDRTEHHELPRRDEAERAVLKQALGCLLGAVQERSVHAQA